HKLPLGFNTFYCMIKTCYTFIIMHRWCTKALQFFLILILSTGWIFSGWPQIFNFPPKIEEAYAQTADFNIQRGCTIMASASATATLTAGSEYTAPTDTSKTFIRIVNARLTGNGRTVGGGNQNADDYYTYFSDPDLAGGSVTLSRAGTTNDNRVCWEIIEYIGFDGGANEIIIRDINTATYVSTNTTVDGGSANGVSSDSDIVVFITGQNNMDTGRADLETGLSTAEWLSSTDVPRFTRGTAGSDANSVSYAVVEFTGSNWAVQRIEHNFIAAGSTETETITDVGALSRAFFHSQFRNGNGGLDELGAEAWLSATNEASFLLQSGATTPSGAYSVAWIVSNSETTANTKMNVQHISGSRAAADISEGANNEEDEWTDTITAVGTTAQTSIMGESGRSAGAGTAAPRGAIALYLNSTTGAKLYQSDDGQPQNYRFQIIEWPKTETPIYSVSITSSGVIEYGFVELSTASSTVGNGYTQTAENDGNTTEKLNVKSSNASGGTAWTLAGSIGSNQFTHEFSTTTGATWTVMPDSATYVTAAPSVVQSGTVNFDFRLTTPSSSSDYQQKSITITIQAVAP
ncbi:MAG: hypothetical protein NUV49_02905, partial [Patescibacteria group bacterium]|nr:hypothetical protein [Patescibacteria group bacterium]